MKLASTHRLAVPILAVAVGACGTVFRGPTQRVQITSSPEGAKVRFGGTESITPNDVQVRGQGFTVLRGEKEDYRPACVLVRAGHHPLYAFLDSIFLGLGWIVDGPTGATRVMPHHVHLELPPLGRGEFVWPLPPDDEIIRRYVRERINICQLAQKEAAELGSRQFWGASFDAELKEVAGGSQGAAIAILKPGRPAFRDGGLEIAVEPDGTGVDLRITNGASTPIRILWDEAAFVASDGTNTRVIHSADLNERPSETQVTTIVAPGGVLYDRAVPVAGWRESVNAVTQGSLYLPLLLRSCSATEEAFIAAAHAREGQTVRFLLPVQGHSGRRDYTLVFRLGRARLRRAKACVDPNTVGPQGPRRPQAWTD